MTMTHGGYVTKYLLTAMILHSPTGRLMPFFVVCKAATSHDHCSGWSTIAPKDGAYRCLRTTTAVSRHNTPAPFGRINPFFGVWTSPQIIVMVENSHGPSTPTISFQLRWRNSWSTLLDPGARNKKSELRGESVSGVGATWRWGKLRSWGKLWSLPWFLWILRG